MKSQGKGERRKIERCSDQSRSETTFHALPAITTSHDDNQPPELNSNDVCVFLITTTGIIITLPEPLTNITAKEILNAIYQEISQTKKITNEKAQNFFSLWMISPYLELQLKPSHHPFKILNKWDSLLLKYGPPELNKNHALIVDDKPILNCQRNVFVDSSEERRLEEVDVDLFGLLYEEAKINILDGRYPCKEYAQLAAIQAAIQIKYPTSNKPAISLEHFFANFTKRIEEFIPIQHQNEYNKRFSGFMNSSNAKISIIESICEQYIREDLSLFALMKKYMEICWSLPYYGSAFFNGQIEKSVSGISTLFSHYDSKVWVAINRIGVHVINKKDSKLLLSLTYDQLKWNLAIPNGDNDDKLPCLFLQFNPESQEESKILQIFSKQVTMMKSLINSFITNESTFCDSVDSTISRGSTKSACTPDCEISKLTLATLSKDGTLIPDKRFSTLKKATLVSV